MTLNSGGTSTFSLLESLVGGEQSEGGLVPVFLHHLGNERLVDSPVVESQVIGSLVHHSANHLLHLFLKHLVVMAVLLAIVPHGGLLSHSKYTLTSHPSAHSWRLKNFFAPSVLMYIMTKPWGFSSPGFFPLMPGTLRALQGSRDAPDED